MKPNGCILYEGKSRLDGAPIVVIATGLNGSSGNRKTGDMIQTWIIRSDLHPLEALRGGDDTSICGDCPHRSKASGGTSACYVNVSQAPTSIWNAYKRGTYGPVDWSRFAGRSIRFGAYGDPTAAPLALWRKLGKLSASNTGYTHQWRKFPGYRGLLMASVDTPAEALDARGKGWRTFRVRTAAQPLQPGEFVCPASAEAGKRLVCAECTACDGNRRGEKRASVAIVAHGVWAGSFSA